MIYRNTPAGTGVAQLLDGCMLNLAAAKAIRNRRHLLAAEILSSFMAASKEFHVASLGCGPVAEIFDVLDRADDRGRLQVSCIDIDREALTYVEARAREQGVADRDPHLPRQPDLPRDRQAGARPRPTGPDLQRRPDRQLQRRPRGDAHQLDARQAPPGRTRADRQRPPAQSEPGAHGSRARLAADPPRRGADERAVPEVPLRAAMLSRGLRAGRSDPARRVPQGLRLAATRRRRSPRRCA